MPTTIIYPSLAPFTHDDTPYPPPIYDPAAGKEALDHLGPELGALAEEQIITLRVDVEGATYAVLGVVGFVSSPDVHARFARLPAEEFDMANVDGLQPACFATIYALAEARAAGALADTALLPPPLAAEAVEIEARMQALCEYQLGDDPTVRPELDRLRPGSGHRDLANDLLGYARIYELRADVVTSDSKLYRPSDAPRAMEIAGIMIQKMSAAMTPKARAAFARYARAWTVLGRRYEEVRAAGMWLFRNDASALARFPSLFSAGRPKSGRKRKAAPKAAEGTGASTNGASTDAASTDGGATNGGATNGAQPQPA